VGQIYVCSPGARNLPDISGVCGEVKRMHVNFSRAGKSKCHSLFKHASCRIDSVVNAFAQA